MSVACSGASIGPSVMSAAISIWTWPPEFLVIYQNCSFTMATEFPVIYHLATMATELSEGVLTIAM